MAGDVKQEAADRSLMRKNLMSTSLEKVRVIFCPVTHASILNVSKSESVLKLDDSILGCVDGTRGEQ